MYRYIGLYVQCLFVQFWLKNVHTLNFVYEVDDARKFTVKWWSLFMHFMHNATYQTFFVIHLHL